ncbi:MAG: hypothetical protein OIN86_06610 [Candidatus Methanoperedens sp.]|nr:hypothetical protein [Candidatus Methanoperedens sp.]CAG0955740.1 hypothetical protein METP1_00437 [Methanosarcinales archaeon]
MQETEPIEQEEIKEIKNVLSDLTAKFENKFDELSKSIAKKVGEQKEHAEGKISENPLAYMAGAFVGGVIVGYVIGRGKG